MGKSMDNYKMSINLTPREAQLVWGLLDGVIDAGAYEDGLSTEERDAAWKVSDALAKIMRKAARHD